MFQVDLPILCHNVVGKSRVNCAPFGDQLCHVRGWIQQQMHHFFEVVDCLFQTVMEVAYSLAFKGFEHMEPAPIMIWGSLT
jgi:hypothetical protein